MLSAHSPNFVYKTYETLLPANNHPTSHSIEETNFSSLKNEWWNYSWAANNDPDSVDIQYIEIDNAKKNLIITPPETPQVVGKCIHGSQSLKCEECSKLNKCPHGRKVNIKVLLLKDKRIFFSQVVVKDVVVHQTVNITAKGQFAELAKVAQFVNMGREEVIAVNAVNSGGTSICEHDRRRYECRQCNGKGICEHQRVRSTCKECGGSRIVS
ncbi:hypothetical protein HDU92_008552 [Lobulomyces angularis]|nr:hypothetical protein HDU92_008552 [Lobulomyces angularis]